MKTFSVLFCVACLAASSSSQGLPSKLLSKGLSAVSRGIDAATSGVAALTNFDNTQEQFKKASSAVEQNNILQNLAKSFVSVFSDAEVLKDLKPEEISKNFISNARETLTTPKNPLYSLTLNNPLLGLSKDLFKSLLGTTPSRESASDAGSGSTTPVSDLPKCVDWRDKCGPVKNQAQCGSCWAFAAVGVTECHVAIAENRTEAPVLSEQHLMDCSSEYKNATSKGCEGGKIQDGYGYMRFNQGLNTNESYPYEAADGACRQNSNEPGTGVTDYKFTKANDEDDLLRTVAEKGPVAVAVDANKWSAYGGGVFSCTAGGKFLSSLQKPQINHGVVVVGYCEDALLGKYWIVKNSWGSSWGEDGYIRIARGSNQCGIAGTASYPIIN